MITWRDILTSLNMVDKGRLDDPAVLFDGEGDTKPLDVLVIDVPEIGDERLVAITLENIDDA